MMSDQEAFLNKPGISTDRRQAPMHPVRGAAGRYLLAGLTLAAITIPEQMATAKLGGFEPQLGLWAFVAATLGFVIFGASRSLTAGADSTITPIFSGTLAALAAAGTAPLGSAAVTLALLVGILLALSGLFKLGWIANLLSMPVITGFLAGIAVHILASQLPNLLGIAVAPTDTLSRLAAVAEQLQRLNPFATAIGLSVFLLMVVGERISDRLPAALVGIGLAMAAVVVFDLKARGVTTVGPLPLGLPPLQLPSVNAMRELVPLALLIALVVMMQTAAVDRGMRQPGDADVTDRNFVGIGAGNIAAALLGTFPVNASPPRSAILQAAGGTSQFAAVIAGVVVAAVALGGGALLANVPNAALAGVLLFVATRIFRAGDMARIGRQAPTELLLVLLTAAAIVLLPIQTGVAIGIALSLLHGVWVTTQARPIELWPLPGTTIWWPSAEAADAEKPIEGVLVLAFQAPLLFANAEVFKRGITSFIEAQAVPPSLVVLEASGIADIDYTAAQAMREVIAYCHNRGITFAIARLEAVRAHEALERLGILSQLGPNLLTHSVDEAVRAHMPDSSSQRS